MNALKPLKKYIRRFRGSKSWVAPDTSNCLAMRTNWFTTCRWAMDTIHPDMWGWAVSIAKNNVWSECCWCETCKEEGKAPLSARRTQTMQRFVLDQIDVPYLVAAFNMFQPISPKKITKSELQYIAINIPGIRRAIVVGSTAPKTPSWCAGLHRTHPTLRGHRTESRPLLDHRPMDGIWLDLCHWGYLIRYPLVN